MKAILIDPVTRTIKEVDHTGDLKSIYGHLECSTFEAPVTLNNGDIMYCDEEAWCRSKDGPYAGFMFLKWEYAILGKGLIVGTGTEGEDLPCKSNPDDFKDIIWKDDAEMTKQGLMSGLI
jgi:hypothetical protein